MFTATPAAPLAGGTHYKVKVSGAVQTAAGGNLTPFVSTGFSTPLSPATSLGAVAHLQSIDASWVDPVEPRFDHAELRVFAAGSSTALQTVTRFNGLGTATALVPGHAYDLQVVAVDVDGDAAAPLATSAPVTAALSGSAADFAAAQAVPLLRGLPVSVAWSDTDLYVGVAGPGGVPPLNVGDALWVGIDTDPATDATGDMTTVSAGQNDMIWPFKTNAVVAMQVNGASSTQTSIRAVGGTWSALATDSFHGLVDEVRIPRSALGTGSGPLRLAVACINPSTGFVFDLGPVNVGATDVTGFFGSLTSSIALHHPFDLAHAQAPFEAGALGSAPALVKLSVSASSPNGAVKVKVKGSLHPLSYTLSNSSYTLTDDGAHGDDVASDGVFTGTFNLGGSTDALYFVFADQGGGEPHFGPGSDRVYTLSGSSEAVPPQAWNVPYDLAHGFQLTFQAQNAGSPTELRGNVAELGNFTGTGAPLTGSGTVSTTVTFGAGHDFAATPLHFKLIYGATFEGGTDHTLNDDVLNQRTLTWQAGDSQGF